MEVCCLSVFRHQQALARHTEFWTAPKCDCQITCSIMYKRSCLADAHLHWREGHRNCYCWSLKTFCAGFRRQESCGECSALQTLLHSAALLHEKLPLVSVFVFYRNSRRKTTRSELATCPQPHIYNISCWFVKWVFRCGLALSMRVSLQFLSARTGFGF